MWDHDPLSHDSLIPQMNSLREILEARNAVIQADSPHAIAACLNHQLTDRRHGHFPIGSSVQIAVDKKWTGAFRVVAHSAGNLLIERGDKILKWPKCKTRMANLENRDEMGQIQIPANAKVWNKRKQWLEGEYPEDYQPHSSDLPDSNVAAPDVIDVHDSPMSEQELTQIGQQTLDAPEADGYGGEDPMGIGMIYDAQQPGHVIPESTYILHGSLICERINEFSLGDRLGASYVSYYAMGVILADGFTYRHHSDRVTQEQISSSRDSQKTEYMDQDVLDGFDPSGVPPRIAPKLIPARQAIEREITDLLAAKPHEPPAMVEVALNDSRYLNVPRSHSTLVTKRKGIDSYKGRLCARGDTVPLLTTAFVSSPTAHRCAAKLVCAIASQLIWKIHAIDVSLKHSFNPRTSTPKIESLPCHQI